MFHKDVGTGIFAGSNVGIKRLDLSWNHIRREGAIAVCNALRVCNTVSKKTLIPVLVCQNHTTMPFNVILIAN